MLRGLEVLRFKCFFFVKCRSKNLNFVSTICNFFPCNICFLKVAVVLFFLLCYCEKHPVALAPLVFAPLHIFREKSVILQIYSKVGFYLHHVGAETNKLYIVFVSDDAVGQFQPKLTLSAPLRKAETPPFG